MRAAEHAPRDRFNLLEGLHCLAEIVERGAAGVDERRCIILPSTATATASLYFLSAWYCSALPPRCIFLHICLWPRRQWSCWQVLLQYLVLHLTQRGASWASGAAQAAHVVRIILRWREAFASLRGGCRFFAC